MYLSKVTILYVNVDMYNVDINLNCRCTRTGWDTCYCWQKQLCGLAWEMQILFFMCISGKTKVRMRLPFSRLWHDRRRKERRGGSNKRLQSWGSVRLLSCQKNGKEKREIKLSCDSKPIHNALMHVHKIAPTCSSKHARWFSMNFFTISVRFVFMRARVWRQRCSLAQRLSPGSTGLRAGFSLINSATSFIGQCKPHGRVLLWKCILCLLHVFFVL